MTFSITILGFIQGISEFLPISSSGHLAVLQQLFNIKEGNLFFAEMLHFGTLLSIFVIYRKRIGRLIVEFINFFVEGFKNKTWQIKNTYQKMAFMILLSAVPAAVMGLLFEDFFESLYSNFIVIGICFIFTGILLYLVDHIPSGHKGPKTMKFQDAFFAGIMQALAIMPGISRSGSTISGLLFAKVDRKLATEFAFLMSIPPILGASLMGIIKAVKDPAIAVVVDFNLIIGVVASFIVGIIAITTMIKLLRDKKLYYFSYYLIPLGILTILLDLFGFVG